MKLWKSLDMIDPMLKIATLEKFLKLRFSSKRKINFFKFCENAKTQLWKDLSSKKLKTRTGWTKFLKKKLAKKAGEAKKKVISAKESFCETIFGHARSKFVFFPLPSIFLLQTRSSPGKWREHGLVIMKLFIAWSSKAFRAKPWMVAPPKAPQCYRNFWRKKG